MYFFLAVQVKKTGGSLSIIYTCFFSHSCCSVKTDLQIIHTGVRYLQFRKRIEEKKLYINLESKLQYTGFWSSSPPLLQML